jgi:pimeloyl-ACP methyl ester carboxylesterase
VAVFRGTEPGNPRDYVTDSRFLPAPLEGAIRVHRGFRDAFEADGVVDRLGKRIEDWSRSGREVWLAGHSLGGALATLAARKFGMASGAYTLGSPRVGNEALWKAIRIPVYRVVNFSDLVTMVPTAVRGTYVHGGELKYIDAAGRLRADLRTEAVVADRLRWPGGRYADVLGRWWRGEMGQIPMRTISDHSPLHYALHLWNNYVATAGEA